MALNERISSNKGKCPRCETWAKCESEKRHEVEFSKGLYQESEEMTMSKFDVAKMVTDRIIEQMESGQIPWEKPWVGTNGAWSRSTGKYYSLLNQLMLPAGEYATIKQINEAGGKVNKGSKAKQVVFWKMLKKTETNDAGEEVEKTIPILRYYNVFNVETDTNLEVKHEKVIEPSGVDPIEGLENIKSDYCERGAVTFDEERGDRAFYAPMIHRVVVPEKAQFENVAEYYSTVFHELGHSTGHHTLLGRIDPSHVSAFGSDDYSREELVAELTACAVLANTGVETSSSFRNNTAYIQSWVRALKEDAKAIVWASSRAQKAYNLIMNIEEESESADE